MRRIKRITYAMQTRYTKLFEKVYWGAFKYDEKNEGMKTIFENRNKFVEKYQIKSVVSKYPKYFRELLDINKYKFTDHSEVYETNDKSSYLFIISPYTPLHCGKEIDPLYSPTYMAIIPKKYYQQRKRISHY